MCNSTDCLLQMVFPYGPTLMVLHVENKNGNSVIDYVLLSQGNLDHIHKFSLGEWTPESDHKALCIDLKRMHRFDCEKAIEDNKQPHLRMNPK